MYLKWTSLRRVASNLIIHFKVQRTYCTESLCYKDISCPNTTVNLLHLEFIIEGLDRACGHSADSYKWEALDTTQFCMWKGVVSESQVAVVGIPQGQRDFKDARVGPGAI